MNTQRAAQRAQAKKNLLTAAFMVARQRRLIRDDDERVAFDFEIVGRPALGCVRMDAFEIAVHAIVDPTPLARESFACCHTRFRRELFGAASAVGWIDRATGKLAEVTGDFCASNSIVPLLAAAMLTKARSASARRPQFELTIGDSR